MLYICWDADNGDEGDYDPVEANWPDDAAKDFADRCCMHDSEYQERRTVHVRDPSTRVVKVFEVVAEPTIVYHAYERQQEEPTDDPHQRPNP